MKKQILSLLIIGIFLCMAACGERTPGGETGIPTPTASTEHPTSLPEKTPTPTDVAAPTDAPQESATPAPTNTPTVTPTQTPEPTATNTPAPTNTPTPTSTPTPTNTPTPIPVELAKTEKIPVVYVETENEQVIVSRDDYVNCKVSVFNVPEEQYFWQKDAGIRVRGNSSAYYGNVDKILANEVPYRIKFEKKINMVGLNDGAECKSWVLLRADEGLVRDDIALRLGRTILGERYYCSDGQLVHLYINKEFKGVYLLCEQSQVNKNRVNITEPKENYTGTDIGYLVEIDNYANSADHPYFKMYYEKATVTDLQGETQKFGWANYSVKSDTYSDAQNKYISKYITNVFTIVYQACEFRTYYTLDENHDLVPAPYDNAKDTIAAVMDLDSVVASYILEEIMHDMDCGEGSFYMCVDFAKNSSYPKLTFVCPWDYDWTCRDDAQGKYYAAAFNDPKFVEQYGDRSLPWFVLLMKQDWFVQLVKEHWTELQKDGKLYAVIQEERDYMAEYKADLNRKKSIATATGEVVLKWIEKRIKWLDEVWMIQ